MSSGCYADPVKPDPGASEATPVSVSLSEATDGLINIHFDETVTHDGLELRLLEINDSRCPTGVNCVWAGEVKAIIEATDPIAQASKPVEVQLTLQARRRSTTATVFAYELELLSVNPYPKNKVTPERSSHVIEIKISKAPQSQ